MFGSNILIIQKDFRMTKKSGVWDVRNGHDHKTLAGIYISGCSSTSFVVFMLLSQHFV